MRLPDSILLLGPTGSGKTPLGDLLAERGLRGRPCRHFDFGARLRSAVEAPEAGPLHPDEVAYLREVLRTGALLRDEDWPIAAKLLKAFIEGESRAGDLLVLNGLPRHVGQARDIAALVRVRGVVQLDCPEEVVFQRLRRDTGGDRAGRGDDTHPLVRAKLETYRARVLPLIEHYRRSGAPVVSVPVGPDTTAEEAWRVVSNLHRMSEEGPDGEADTAMLTRNDTACILVDFQERLARAMFEADGLLDDVLRLLRGLAVLKVPVLWTEQNPPGLGGTVGEVAELLEGAPIPKLSFSCCGEPAFVEALEALGRRQLLLAGIEAHVCVYQTAADLIEAGSDVHVVSDAVSSRSPENKAVGLEKCADLGAGITSVETVLFELLRVAEGEEFRQILQIVR